MSVSRLRLANFRSFRDQNALDLCPVTLVYGPNNVGKSALVRLLPLVADSLAPGREALEFGSRLADADLSFDRLRWRGSREHSGEDIELGVDFADGASVTWSLRHVADWTRTVVSSLTVTSGSDQLRAEWRMRRGEERDAELTYTSAGTDARFRFEGLLPPASLVGAPLEPVRRQLEALRDGVIWLGSVRPPPGRRTPTRGSARWSLASNGADSPVVLATEPAVLQDVERWYREALGLTLQVREASASEVQVEVQRSGAIAPRVDMLDCGEGPGQVLPVVTALAMVKHHAERRGPSILCVEEPESHLHPAAQQALAALVCECAAVEGVRVVLETHSPYLLYAIHLEIMRGFPMEKVALHWVRQDDEGASTAEASHLLPDGSIQGPWPPGVFETEYALLSEMERLRQAAG